MVVAGVVERGGDVLICQRRDGQAHAYKWEFPGGKVEGGERPEDALVRELNEELGIEATVDTELMRYEFGYNGRSAILLIFFRVRSFAGEPENSEFEQMIWCPRGNLRDYDFLEGDREFLISY